MKIAFTSCTRYEAFQEQPEWQLISKQDPDFLFLLGDNIYMDYGIPPFSKEPVGCPESYSNKKFEKLMKQKYQNQFTLVSPFMELVAKMRAKNGFFGIWDDHDFGWDNAKGAHMSKQKKRIARKLFHKYLDCSTNYPHTYYHIDTPLARVIFLDNRSDAENKGNDSKLISEEQFSFIKKKLKHDLTFTIICGGVTMTEGSENWTNYPKQIKKLCKLLEKADNVIFLGGDIHANRFVKPKYLENLNVTTPVQLISSGMQVNYWGLGLPYDDQHNWAMLELQEDKVKVRFYDKHGLERKVSKKATKFLKKHFTLKKKPNPLIS